ncbi:MAB_1171c family putative transporter [Streptomyces sp. NPDC057136]|uniref:MAB_1171c family putative transporter n=1 Tax=Streptomyces sp. NPDC057136 TaxID=3346029 RepID=UPI0036336820
MSAGPHLVCAALALVAFVEKVRVLRAGYSAVRLALAEYYFLLLVIGLVAVPAVWSEAGRAVGTENFSGLVTQTCVILVTVCQQLVLLRISHERVTAYRKAIFPLIGLGVTLTAMTTLFFAVPMRPVGPADFSAQAAAQNPMYLAFYLIAFTVGQINIGITCRRHAHIPPSVWLRRGLGLLAMTLPLSLIYAACGAVGIFAERMGVSAERWEPMGHLSLVLVGVMQAVGWMLPDIGKRVIAVRQWSEHRRAFRALGPLHRAVTARAPEVVIPMKAGAGLNARLYRVMIEVRDAQWALRPWMDPALAGALRRCGADAGLTDDELAAAVEAAQIRAAIEAKDLDNLPPEPVVTPLSAEPGDLAAELAFQRRLARYFADPLGPVRRTRAGATASGTSPSSRLLPRALNFVRAGETPP